MARKLGRLKIVGLRIGGQGIGTAAQCSANSAQDATDFGDRATARTWPEIGQVKELQVGRLQITTCLQPARKRSAILRHRDDPIAARKQ